MNKTYIRELNARHAKRCAALRRRIDYWKKLAEARCVDCGSRLPVRCSSCRRRLT